MRRIKLLFLGAAVNALIGGAAQAGPVNPPAGNAIQNQSLPQTAVFNVSSATVRGQLSVGSVKFPNGTIQISSAPSVAFPSLAPGVMQIVGVSSSVVTAAVSLSSSVIGNLGVSHLNSGTNASTNTWWNGGGTWTLIPVSNPPFACSVGGTQISSPTLTVNFDSATFAGSQSPTGTANLTLVPSSVTLQGNGFNGANQLLKLNSSALVPNASIDTSSVTKLGPTITLGQQTIGIYVASVTANAPLTGSGTGTGKAIVLGVDASSVTLMGNLFNGNSQLVKTDSSGRLPAINGSLLTNLPPTEITTGSTNYIQNTTTPQASSNFSVTAGNVQGLLTVGAVTSSGAVSGTSLSLQTQTQTDTLTENMASPSNGYQTIVYRSSGTVLSPLNVANGYELGSNFWRAYVANNWHNAGAIRAFVDSGSLASGAPSEILFATDDGTDSDKYRFAIRSNGQARFGTNLTGSETQTALVHVDGSLSTLNGVDIATMTFRSGGPGLLHVVATSSNVVSGPVDVTSEVTGVLPTANGGTGQSTYTDGTLLIGNSATGGLVATQLLQGPEISVVNGNGTITIGVSGMVTTSSSTVNFLQGIKTTTETITSAAAGVMHVDGSSNVVTGLVSMSTETTGAFISSVNVSGAFNVTANGANNTAITLSANASSTTLQGNTFNSGSELLQLSGGLIPNANVDGSSVTKQGNTFNGASQLLQLSSSDLIPNALVDTSSVTKLGANPTTSVISEGSRLYFTTARATSAVSASAPLTYANGVFGVDGTSVTLQSNTFNAASKLVQLNSSTQYPALDGSLITNLTLTGTPTFSTVTVRNAISASTATLAISTITVSNGSQIFVSTSSGGNPPGYSFTGFTTSGLGANNAGVPIIYENGNAAVSFSNLQTAFTNGSMTTNLSSSSGLTVSNLPIRSSMAGATPSEYDFVNGTNIYKVQATPTANRTYTVPDVGQNTSFTMNDATQTLNGANTFSSTTTFNGVVNASTVTVSSFTATNANITTGAITTLTGTTVSASSVTATTSLIMPSGSAALPGLVFSSNKTTGLYFPGSNDVRMSNGGVNTYIWNASGYFPATDNTMNLGNGGLRWVNVAASSLTLTSGIVGVTDGSNAPTGDVGEYIENIPGTKSLSSAAYVAVSTITLTAGDWDLTGMLVYFRNSATVTNSDLLASIGTVSQSGSGQVYGSNTVEDLEAGNTWSEITLVIPNYRVSITGSTAYYLNVQGGTFTGGPVQSFGSRLSARRVR